MCSCFLAAATAAVAKPVCTIERRHLIRSARSAISNQCASARRPTWPPTLPFGVDTLPIIIAGCRWQQQATEARDMKAAAPGRIHRSRQSFGVQGSAVRAWPGTTPASALPSAAACSGRNLLVQRRVDSRPWLSGAARYVSRPHQRVARGPSRDVAAQAALTLLAQDVLWFLGSTVAVIPLFKRLRLSPVLGFLAAGVLLHQFGCASWRSSSVKPS